MKTVIAVNPGDNKGCIRLVQTSSVFLALFALGLVSAITGTTLFDLSQLLQSDVENTSLVLTLRGFGVFAGSLLSTSVLYRILNGKLVLASAMIVGGVANAIVPFSGTLLAAQGAMLVVGMCVGILETGSNVWLVHLWKGKVAPAFQMYHLSFGVGALLPPVLSEPFLSYKEWIPLDNGSVVERYSDTHIQVPYGLYGGVYSLTGVFMLVLFFFDSTDFSQVPSNTEEVPKEKSSFFEWIVVGHLFVYILVLVGTEMTLAQMLGVYLVNNRNLTFDKHSASFVVADYWASFTSGRVVAILLSFKFLPHTIIVLVQVICVLGALVLFFLSTTYNWAVWLSIGIMGFGLAPSYGAAMAWAVRYVRLRFVHMTLVLIASCIGQSAPPLLVGLSVKANPTIFVYVIAIYMTIHTINVLAMLLSTRNRPVVFDVKDTASKSVENQVDFIDMPEI